MNLRPIHAVAVAASIGLAACGGGGGGEGPPASPGATTCATGAAFEIIATPTVDVGKNAAAAVAGCRGAIADPRWEQTAGAAVKLLSDRTQTISFEATTAGSYAFQVAFRDAEGIARTQAVAIAAIGTPADTRLTLRVSQSSRMGGNVSVRAWPTFASGETLQSIIWTQLEGPAVTLDTRDSHVALFVAPEVMRDTPIRLRATLRTASGISDSDEALVLIERHVQAPASDADAVWRGAHVSRVHSYKAAGRYAGVLAACVYDAGLHYRGTRQNTCPLTRLPFLAQDTGGQMPSVEQVMDRVLVSHDWLGRNFEDFLRTQDIRGDFRRLLNGVTAIVLGAQVRPSFYQPVTGAIYLDGDNFWLSPEERDSVNEAPDFRSDFDADLQYSGLWRYVQNGRSIFVAFDPRSRVSRDLGYLLDESGWLMYHELGHAQDFLPPSQYGALDSALDPWGNIGPRYASQQLASDRLSSAFPLLSAQMAGLGQVKFQGVTANATQRAYTPDQVAGFFSIDRASDEYNYSTTREDLAMSLEEFLMQHRLGILRDKAISDKIAASSTSATAIVRWGQRGRVGEANIKPRVRAIVAELLPWVDPAAVDTLAAPLPMRPGESWGANLALPAPPRAAKALNALPTRMEMWQFRKEVERMQHHRHAGVRELPPR